jgi:hypothetical protein
LSRQHPARLRGRDQPQALSELKVPTREFSWQGTTSASLWRVGFRKPNRFGYGPDGYILQIMAKDPVTDPPTLKGDSPCFSGDLPDDRSPFPMVLKAD